MTRAILALVVFGLMGCIQGPAGEDGGLTKTASIPSLNVWLASFDSTHHVHVLMADRRYYDPGLTMGKYEGSPVWTVNVAPGPFSTFTARDAYLLETNEACVYPDTLSAPNTFQRKRKIERWALNGSSYELITTYYASECAPGQRLDSLLSHGSVSPEIYAVDSVIRLDAKSLPYVESITYYYRSLFPENTLRETSYTYSSAAGGILMTGSPFLGEYRVYY